MDKISKIFEFASLIEALKREERFKGVDFIKGDTVAAHCWRLSIITFIVIDELNLDLDPLKVVKLALAHDLPESITGDIASRIIKSNNLNKIKKIKEKKAILKIKAKLPKKSADEILLLWKEYHEGKTEEAKFVCAMDKIEGLYTYLEKSEKILNPKFTATYADMGYRTFPEIAPFINFLKENLKNRYKKEGLSWKKEYNYLKK